MTKTRLLCAALAAVLMAAGPAAAKTYIGAPSLEKLVKKGKLPPVEKRLPETPRVITLTGDRTPGRHGGTLRTLMGRSKDTRIMTVYGYARLVVYNRDYELVPDILEKVEVNRGREFTMHLRRGHKWSTGKPFTSRDFEFFWTDVANDKCVYSFGLPNSLLVEGEPPKVEIIDKHTVKYSWSKPNPYFLPALAGASPLYIYMPFHYLKKYHPKYSKKVRKKWDKARKKDKTTCGKWPRKFRKKARQYRFENTKLPVLQPWVNTTPGPAERFEFKRNPYFHRVDQNGRQLPYINTVVLLIADSKIIAAKTGAGESDLQGRYLRFDDFTFLKRSELRRKRFKVYQWKTATGAHIALYPNLNHRDPVWRKLFQDVRFRRALSLGIDRREINEIMYYGLADIGANTVLPRSPLYKPSYRRAWSYFDLAAANKLLDEVGLTKRDSEGFRLLPDGRPLEIIVEAASEGTEYSDVMRLISDNWQKLGIRLFQKSTRREMLRRRIVAGLTHISLWSGLDYANLTADMPPDELAPTGEIQLQWPQWGLWYESRGRRGQKPTMPKVIRLLELLKAWQLAEDKAERTRIWHEILQIHSDEVYTIGILGGVIQPLAVSDRMRNVPKTGVWAWDPGARFGIYQMDTFWIEKRGGDRRAAADR